MLRHHQEYGSGRILHCERGGLPSRPPYPIDENALVVTYDAPAQLSCHRALGWALPANVLDLRAEYLCETAGLDLPGGVELVDVLAPQGFDALGTLFRSLLPHISLAHALLRGRYAKAVIRMEEWGVPLDVEALGRLRDGWPRIRQTLIEEVDRDFGVFEGGKFNPRRWAAWLKRNGLRWPKLESGELDLSHEAFRDMARLDGRVTPMKELLGTLAMLRTFRLAVSKDGRHRSPLRPFSSKTGRNQPSSSRFIFGPAAWLRGLIKPAPGWALAYVDYAQQEFGVGAALSRDPAMRRAYESGDPYLEFARQAGAVPPGATRQSHPREREGFKACALGVQYGMGANGLAVRHGFSSQEARGLLGLHKRTYPAYWTWSDQTLRQAKKEGALSTVFGWKFHVRAAANPRSIRNFPLQASGAEMLRLACWCLVEKGVRVCAPVHDALLIEAPEGEIEGAVGLCRRTMSWASEQVLRGFRLRTEAKVVRFPDRYMDERGEGMWNRVFDLLDRKEGLPA